MELRLEDYFVWLIFPIASVLFPFVYRFLIEPYFFFYHVNISITTISITYILTYYAEKRKDAKLTLLTLLFFVPTIILNLIGGTEIFYEIRRIIAQEGGLQSLVGMLAGISSIYTYIIGLKIGKRMRSTSYEIQHVLPILTLYSAVVIISIYARQTGYELFWPLRSILLTLGFIVATLSLTIGIISNKSLYSIRFVYGILSFILGFITGTTVTVLTKLNDIYPSMSAFVVNTILIIGVIGYILSDKKSKLYLISKKLISIL